MKKFFLSISVCLSLIVFFGCHMMKEEVDKIGENFKNEEKYEKITDVEILMTKIQEHIANKSMKLELFEGVLSDSETGMPIYELMPLYGMTVEEKAEEDYPGKQEFEEQKAEKESSDDETSEGTSESNESSKEEGQISEFETEINQNLDAAEHLAEGLIQNVEAGEGDDAESVLELKNFARHFNSEDIHSGFILRPIVSTDNPNLIIVVRANNKESSENIKKSMIKVNSDQEAIFADADVRIRQLINNNQIVRQGNYLIYLTWEKADEAVRVFERHVR